MSRPRGLVVGSTGVDRVCAGMVETLNGSGDGSGSGSGYGSGSGSGSGE